jgi:hypothetical protein
MKTRLALAMILALALAAGSMTGCSSDPKVTRIETEPPEAELRIGSSKQMYYTPADVAQDVDPDDEITIRKKGYATYRGPLGDLQQVAEKTYRLKMVKE